MAGTAPEGQIKWQIPKDEDWLYSIVIHMAKTFCGVHVLDVQQSIQNEKIVKYLPSLETVFN